MANWSGYDNSCVGSIYLAVYELVAVTPAVAACKERIVHELDEARLVSLKVYKEAKEHYSYEKKPAFLFTAKVGEKEIDYGASIRELNNPLHFEIGHLLPDGECDKIYFDHVGEGKLFRPHGLMNERTVYHGTQAGKNRFSLWLKHRVLNSDEIRTPCRIAQERLYREAHAWLDDPNRNQEYLNALYAMGKKRIVKVLQEYKHLPDFVLKEAFQMFMISDIMELDDD